LAIFGVDPWGSENARVAKLEQALGICELARFTPR